MKMFYIIEYLDLDGSLIDRHPQYFKSLQDAINYIRDNSRPCNLRLCSFVFNDSINCHHVDGKMFFD